MQRIYNFMSLAAFIMSGTLTGATIVAFARVPIIVQDYLDEATSGVIDEVTEVIPSQIEQAMPELPKATGPAIRSPF